MQEQEPDKVNSQTTNNQESSGIEIISIVDSDGNTSSLQGKASVPVSNAGTGNADQASAKSNNAPKMSQAERKKLAEAKALERERKRVEKEEELKRKEDERERLKAAKEQERLQKKAEKEAEKEKQRLEKEAEIQKRKTEKEAERNRLKALESAKQAGFKDDKTMARSKNLMMSFLKKDSKAGDRPPAAVQTIVQQANPAATPESDLLDRKRAELDPYLKQPLSPHSVQKEFSKICASWRSQRSSMKQLKGVPPSWSRKPNICTDFQTLAAQHYGDNVDLSTVTTWRRKLLQHHDSQRPAYFGSHSKTSTHITGRRPLGKEPTLDYEVMSDEEWEDEGDGESLASQDEEEEREREEEEEEDGFVVEDGHLSEDEGIVMEENDEGVIDPAAPGVAVVGGKRIDPQLQLLEGALEKARRSNRPLILCSLPNIQYEPTSTLDPSVLSVLSSVCLTPDVVIKPPQILAPSEAKPQQQPQQREHRSVHEASGKSGAGRPRSEFPQQMLTELLDFLGTTSLAAIDKVVTAFVTLHPDKGLSKKGVKLKLKEVASYSSQQRKWVVKQVVTGIKRTPSKRPARTHSNPGDGPDAKRTRLSPGVDSKPAHLHPTCILSPNPDPIAPIQSFFKTCTTQPATQPPTQHNIHTAALPVSTTAAAPPPPPHPLRLSQEKPDTLLSQARCLQGDRQPSSIAPSTQHSAQGCETTKTHPQSTIQPCPMDVHPSNNLDTHRSEQHVSSRKNLAKQMDRCADVNCDNKLLSCGKDETRAEEQRSNQLLPGRSTTHPHLMKQDLKQKGAACPKSRENVTTGVVGCAKLEKDVQPVQLQLGAVAGVKSGAVMADIANLKVTKVTAKQAGAKRSLEDVIVLD